MSQREISLPGSQFSHAYGSCGHILVVVISQVGTGCRAIADSLLVLAPLKDTVSILVQRPKLVAYMNKMGVINNRHLLPFTLQLLLDDMNHFCLGLGLVISPTKTEVVVFNGSGIASTWRIGAQVLPQSASFKYLGLIFHESGTMSYALQRLAHNAVGACAQLRAKFRGLLHQKSFPMIRRLFDALVLPTVSYGSEVWVWPFLLPKLAAA